MGTEVAPLAHVRGARRDLDWQGAYAQYAPSLASYLLRIVGDAELAADLTHETFVRAMRSEARLRDAAALRPWLYRAATNLGLSHLRRARLVRWLPLTAAASVTEAPVSDRRWLVRAALQSISPEQSAALVLAFHEGFTRAEIAEITGTSADTVKTRIARGRRNFIAAYHRLERGLAK